MFASRHPEELKDLAAKAGPNARVGTPAEAASFGDVVLIAVPYSAFPAVTKANLDAFNSQLKSTRGIGGVGIELAKVILDTTIGIDHTFCKSNSVYEEVSK